MKIGFQNFVICAVLGAAGLTSSPALARKNVVAPHSRAWWTNWWLDCQREGTCEYNGKDYYFDAKALKVREGRAPAADKPEETEPDETETPEKPVKRAEDAPEPAAEERPVVAAKPAKKKAASAPAAADEYPDLEAERAEARRNHERAAAAPLPPQNSNCARELARSQAALAKYNTCLKKNKLPTIEWGISGTGFLVDGSRPGLQKKMFAIRDGKCLYEQTVSLGRGSEAGVNGYQGGSKRTPAGLFGLSFNTRGHSAFKNKSLILHGGNAADRGIYAHNGPTGNNSAGCIRLGGGMYTTGGAFERMNKTFRSGVNNVFIFFKDAKAPNDGCGSPQKIEPRAMRSGPFGQDMEDQR